MWYGSAAVCVKNGKLLMVLQGKPDEKKYWSIPSGGKFKKETFETCCLRELEEETGYVGEIQSPLFVKKGQSFGVDVTVNYYRVRIVGGEMKIQDPDELIHDIRWVSYNELHTLELSFPEDLNLLSENILQRSHT